MISHALELTGSGRALRLSAIATSSNALTLEAWVLPATAQRRAVMSVGTGARQLVLAAGNGEVAALYVEGDRSVVLCSAGGVVKANEWSHVAITLSLAGSVKLGGLGAAGLSIVNAAVFHQGKQLASRTVQPQASGDLDAELVSLRAAELLRAHLLQACWIGAACGKVAGFAGRIGEARVWTTAVAAAELAARRTGRARGDEAALAACYPLDRVEYGCAHDVTARRGFAVAGDDARIVETTALPLPSSSARDRVRLAGRGKLTREWVDEYIPAQHITPTVPTYPSGPSGPSVGLGGRGTSSTSSGFDIPAKVERRELRIFDATLEAHAPDGGSLAGANVEVRIDGDLTAIGEAADGTVRLSGWTAGKSYSLPLPSTGRLRLRFLAGELGCPIVRARIDGMPEGLWTLVRPDGAALGKLRDVTAAELARPADGRASPLPAGTGSADAGAFAGLLQTLGRAFPPAGNPAPARTFRPQARFSVGGTLSHAWDDTKDFVEDTYDDGKDAVVGTAQSASGVVVATSTAAVKDAKRTTKSAGQLVAGSGPVADELVRRAASAPAQLGQGAIRTFVDAADQLALVTTAGVDGAARIIEIAGSSIVDGASVAWRVVVAGVEDAIAATVAIAKRVGAEIEKIIDYLAYLFDWQAFLRASDRMYATGEAMIARIPSYVGELAAQQAAMLEQLRTPLDAALGTKSLAQLCGLDLTGDSPGIDEIDYVIDRLNELLDRGESLFQQEVGGTVEDVGGRSALADAADRTSALMPTARFTNPAAALTMPLVELAGGGAAVADSSAGLFDYLFGDLRAQTEAAVGDVTGMVTKRLFVPYLTDTLEKCILGGRELNLLRLVSLVAGIASVLADKIGKSVRTGSIDTRSAIAVQPRTGTATTRTTDDVDAKESNHDEQWFVMACGVVASALLLFQTKVEMASLGKQKPASVEKQLQYVGAFYGLFSLIRAGCQYHQLDQVAAKTRPWARALVCLDGVAAAWLLFSSAAKLKLKPGEETMKWFDRVDSGVMVALAVGVVVGTVTPLGLGLITSQAEKGAFGARASAAGLIALSRVSAAVDNLVKNKASKYVTGGLLVLAAVAEIGEAAYGNTQDGMAA